MADVPSLTLEVLKDIRDEVRKTNERLERLERRQTDTEVRLSTELVALASAVHEVGDMLRTNLSVRTKVEEHEARIAALERKAS